MSSDKLNVDRLMEALSEIFSDKYGCKITFRAIPKDQAQRGRTANDDKAHVG